MNITEVRVKLMHDRTDRLRAFCSITIDDDFVVHDLRVIEGRKGFFVAMPSRKLSDNCPRCGSKNDLRAAYCSSCGAQLDENRAGGPDVSHDKLHVDVAHPINTDCREMIQGIVLEAYNEEVDASDRDMELAGVHEEQEAEEQFAQDEEDIYEEEEDLEELQEKVMFEPEEPEDVPLGDAPEPFEPEHAEGVIENFEPSSPPERGPEPAPSPGAVSAPEPDRGPAQDIAENYEPEPEPGHEEEPAPEPEPDGPPRRVRRNRRGRGEREGGGFGDGIL